MAFKLQASIDPNHHKGLILLNSITGKPLVATGLSLTNSQPIHVAIVDGTGAQVTSFGGTGGTSSSFGSAFPSTGTATGAIDASGNMAGLNLDGSGNLKVSGSLSVGGTVDNSAFTAGTTQGTPAMGFYHSTIDTVTDGRSAAVGITNKRALLVNLNNASGVEIGTSTTPIQVTLANTGANTNKLLVTADPITFASAQPVTLASTTITGTVTISGTVTANAGTNLNTSLLALESGGNLASIKTDVDNLNLAQGATSSGLKGNLILANVTTGAPTYTTAQSNPLSLTTTGLLRVDGSGVTQPVSLSSTTITGTVAVTQSTSPWVVSNGGTFAVQAAQSGTWNITNISGTVSLPTGASTETTLAKLTQAQGSTTSGQSGPLIQGAVTTGAPAYTTAQTSPLSLDTAGNLRTTTTLGAGSAVIGHVITDSGSTTVVTGSVTVAQATASNLKVDLSGTGANTTALKVDGSAVTQPVSGTVTANAGTGTFTVAGNKTNNNAAPGATNVGALVGIANAAAPTYTEGDQVLLSTDLAGNLRITGSISVGGTTDEAAWTAGSSTFTPTGGVFNDTAAALTTGQQGTQRLTANRGVHANLRNASGTEIGTSTTPVQVSLANTATNATAVKVDGSGVTQPVSGTVTTTPPSNASTNIAQINGVTPLMGNGTTGTGSQRVTIASDNTAFSVNSTLSAETTKVIGVVRTADGSGNLLTSTGSALDINIKSGSIANTTFGATQATASSLNATVVQGTAAALAAGWPVINGEASDTTGTFTNATQTTSVTAGSLDGYGNVLISINGTYGTATAVFEGSDDGGTTWYGISEADRTDSNLIESGYTSLTNTIRAWQISNPGWDSIRVRSTAVASGTVNVRISPSAAPTSAGASVSIGTALPTGSNVIGHLITDTGSTTAVTGTVAVTQSTSPWVVAGGGTAGSAATGVVTIQGIASMTKLLVTPDSVALPANQSVNVSQINGVTPLMGNGVTGTGSQRVTIASDNTAFSVNATLSAETTKVIGTVNQGTSPWVVSNGGTFSVQTTADVPGTGATNLGKAEDAGHTTGDTGVMALGVRNDTLAATTNTTADYTQLTTDQAGIVITAGAPRALKGRQVTTITSSTAETTILTSVASTFLDIYGLILTNTSATVTKVSIRDATAGGTISVFEVPPTDTRGFMLPLDSSIPQAAVTNNWTAQCGTSVASLEVTVLYVKRV